MNGFQHISTLQPRRIHITIELDGELILDEEGVSPGVRISADMPYVNHDHYVKTVHVEYYALCKKEAR